MNHSNAIEVLKKFEYSSDGFPKRYPEEAEFVSAVTYLEQNKPAVDGVARFTETFGQLFEEGRQQLVSFGTRTRTAGK